jgi:hypothetical protein
MPKKLNCWEFEKCGREPGGAREHELGVCVAATEIKANKLNNGKNAGRACWPVAGTLCGGIVQGTFAMKLGSCLKCDFYQLVIKEEGSAHQMAREILKKLEV